MTFIENLSEEDEKHYQRELNVTMFASQGATWKESSDYLLKKAGELFARNQDKEAQLLRTLAGEFAEKAVQARKQQQREQDRKIGSSQEQETEGR